MKSQSLLVGWEECDGDVLSVLTLEVFLSSRKDGSNCKGNSMSVLSCALFKDVNSLLLLNYKDFVSLMLALNASLFEGRNIS